MREPCDGCVPVGGSTRVGGTEEFDGEILLANAHRSEHARVERRRRQIKVPATRGLCQTGAPFIDATHQRCL